jgi:hypothetical protein
MCPGSSSSRARSPSAIRVDPSCQSARRADNFKPSVGPVVERHPGRNAPLRQEVHCLASPSVAPLVHASPPASSLTPAPERLVILSRSPQVEPEALRLLAEPRLPAPPGRIRLNGAGRRDPQVDRGRSEGRKLGGGPGQPAKHHLAHRAIVVRMDHGRGANAPSPRANDGHGRRGTAGEQIASQRQLPPRRQAVRAARGHPGHDIRHPRGMTSGSLGAPTAPKRAVCATGRPVSTGLSTFAADPAGMRSCSPPRPAPRLLARWAQ